MQTTNVAPTSELRFLRMSQVLELIPLSRTRIRQLEAAGDFPKRIALGDHAIAYVEGEIREWMAHRIAHGTSNHHGAARPTLPTAPTRAATARKTARKG